MMQPAASSSYLYSFNDHSRRSSIAAGLTTLLGSATRLSAADPSALIASTEMITLRRGGVGSGPTWFHPRCCVAPAGQGNGPQGNGPLVLMTLQEIAGSDYFGPVHWMSTQDLGATWSEPQPVPALGRVKRDDGWDEGVCDVVPEFHAATGTVLAWGTVSVIAVHDLSGSSHRAGRYTRSGAKASGANDAGLTGTIHADR